MKRSRMGSGLVLFSLIAVLHAEPAAAASSEVTLSLNGLDAVTQKIIPILGDKYGLDDIDYDESLASGTLQAYDVFQGKWKNCVKYAVSLDSHISLPLDSNDIEARFKSGNKVETEWDIDSAEIEGDVKVKLSWGEHAGSNAFCAGWDTLLAGFIGTNYIAFDADEFSGDFDFTLKDASKSSTVAIDAITAISLKFGGFVIGDSSILTKVVNWTARTIDSLFTGVTCSSIDECVSDLVTDEVQSGSTKNSLKSSLNDSLKKAAVIEGGVSEDDIELDYSVALGLVETDGDLLGTLWETEISSDEDSDDCADGLRRGTFAEAGHETLGSDLDLTVPLGLIGEAAFRVGKQGLFCVPFEKDFEDAEAEAGAYGYSISSATAGFSTRISGLLVPDGILGVEVESGSDFSLGATAKASRAADAPKLFGGTAAKSRSTPVKSEPERIVVGEDEDRVIITLPVTLADVVMTTTAMGRTEETSADDAEISATLRLEAVIDLDCEGGLFLKLRDAALEDMEGSVSFGDETLDAAEFEDELQEASEGLTDELERFTLLPKVTDLTDLGLYVEIDQKEYDDEAVRIGMSLTDENVCDGDEDDDDDGTAIDPPGGGGYKNPGIDIDLIDRFGDDDDEGKDLDSSGMDAAETLSM